MPNNPVQIILNHNDFIRAPDPGRMGPEKDFFDGKDAAFAEHKATIATSIRSISAAIKGAAYGPAAYLKIQMRTEALAKSYRPNRQLLTNDLFPCVGADGVGTLYFRAPLIYLETLERRVEEAELKVAVNVSRKTLQEYKAPSRARSEVGAVESIEIAPARDKRNFSTSDALQSFRDPRTVSGYHIELFETPGDHVIAADPVGRHALRKSLEETFMSLGAGTQVFLAPRIGSTPVIEFQLTRSKEAPRIQSRIGLATSDVPAPRSPSDPDLSPERHEAALNQLAAHPLVRAIRPPVQLSVDDSDEGAPSSALVIVPDPVAGATYPIVGVIDSGIDAPLSSWVVGRFDYLDPRDLDTKHGSAVAGLVCLASLTNGPNITREAPGCLLYDAPLFPKGSFAKHYPNLFIDFLEELEQAVAEAKSEHNVRVFNLSINAVSAVERHRYSIYASRLDEIADKYGVVFVNSAGNLKSAESRTSWGKRPADVLSYFANRTEPDTIYKPAESVRAISVGALNPSGSNQPVDVPTIYTRRGPGLQVGVKPDVAAYGGAGATSVGEASGLRSITPNGLATDVAGTSYAAPLVARALAGIDVATRGTLGTNGLRAMLIHSAALPEPLRKRGLGTLARQFVGFGQPSSVQEMLETDDHQITLFFESRLTVNERRPAILRFPFEWPASLVESGACSGSARITLVYSPPLDPAFGAEFARVNLDATLSQLQPNERKDGKPSFTNQIAARYLPKTTGLGAPEKALIEHGLKWWPAKQYQSVFERRGEFSSWRLEVTSLVRAEAIFPAEGVPFALLLTIEDPVGAAPVFQEMRLALQASRAKAFDIRSGVRIPTRGT
jgi:Subtilase family